MMRYPGRPVDGSTETLAEANMGEFAATVREQLALESRVHGRDARLGEPVRDRSLDGAGRYGWLLSVGGRRVSVLMPGVGRARMLGVETPIAYVHVNGCPLPWDQAVHHTIPVPR